MFEQIMNEIRDARRIILHRHTNPDGDALGSQIGLYYIIKDNFPEKEVYKVGDSTPRYSFMNGAEMDEIGDELYEDALAILLDCPTSELANDKRYALASKTARIDHHIYCEHFTEIEIVDPTYESCAGMVAAFAKEQGLRLTKRSAAALYTGMVTDSGRFRYDSTSSRTFALASFLMEQPVDISEIYGNLYGDELANVKLRAEFVRKITQYENSSVAYIFTSKEELAAYGCSAFTASRGMVNTMSDIRGIDIWVNFTETEPDGEILCELRSSKYNINPVAVMFGGGGHAKASGASLYKREDIPHMLAELKKLTVAEGK